MGEADMSIIRVRKVVDGEELVLAEEFLEARLSLEQIDARAGALERRRRALADREAGSTAGQVVGSSTRRLRAKTHDWGS
jgi:hypothetical protein